MTCSRLGSYTGRSVASLSTPMARAASARWFRSSTICRSSASIFVRQSLISIREPLPGCFAFPSEISNPPGDIPLLSRRCSDGPQPLNKLCHCRGRVFGCGLLNEPDDGAADDGGIGELAESGHVGGVRDTEAEREGQGGVAAQALS